ncbi:MAG: arginine decarboxylase, pyruvoyl-dependent [Candidatus Tectomicrobia bacterium]|nr:arginine decarboxylase, pyruvoyl-dependent [Candidatus Tectomicrobia bacterium]
MPGIPSKIFLTRGVGSHKEHLTSFEMALRDAHIAEFNLVNVSSIFPPHCKVITRDEGLTQLFPGQICYAVMSRNSTDEANRLIAASIGMAIPADTNQYGYLAEHHSFGQSEEQAGEHAEDLAAYMLATILGVEFDPDKSYDEKKEIWRISGKIVETQNICAATAGVANGIWTTVVSAAVLVP